MSIRRRVEDALELHRLNRFEGALLSALADALAIDEDILPKLIADAPADCHSGYVGWKINSSNVGALS